MLAYLSQTARAVGRFCHDCFHPHQEEETGLLTSLTAQTETTYGSTARRDEPVTLSPQAPEEKPTPRSTSAASAIVLLSAPATVHELINDAHRRQASSAVVSAISDKVALITEGGSEDDTISAIEKSVTLKVEAAKTAGRLAREAIAEAKHSREATPQQMQRAIELAEQAKLQCRSTVDNLKLKISNAETELALLATDAENKSRVALETQKTKFANRNLITAQFAQYKVVRQQKLIEKLQRILNEFDETVAMNASLLASPAGEMATSDDAVAGAHL